MESSILDIDEYNLDLEWKRQPTLYLEMATELADAKGDHDAAKSDFEIVKAKLSMNIRSNPNSFGLDKVTESTVNNALVTQKNYAIAQSGVIKAKHKVDLLQAVVVALEHRKRALESLVSLHGQKYFSEPLARTETDQEALEDATKTRIRTMRNS
jgi:hypothetical protein